MENQFSFEKLKAWQYSRRLVKLVYELVKKLPKEETYALSDQIRRAIVSVSSNIAEGSGRMSKAEQRHFYEIAYGSLMEVYNQLLIAYDLEFIEKSDIDNIKEPIWKTAKVISALRNSIKD